MNLGRKITAAGLTASLLATPFSCSCALAQANGGDGAEGGYNILFIVTDQEH